MLVSDTISEVVHDDVCALEVVGEKIMDVVEEGVSGERVNARIWYGY